MLHIFMTKKINNYQHSLKQIAGIYLVIMLSTSSFLYSNIIYYASHKCWYLQQQKIKEEFSHHRIYKHIDGSMVCLFYKCLEKEEPGPILESEPIKCF